MCDTSSSVTNYEDTKPKPKPNDVKKTVLKKTRKRQIEVLQASFKEVMECVIDAQKTSDEMLFKLEEKRIKLEEAQHDREMQMRREDQEFQLRMMQILSGFPMPYNSHSYYGSSET